jgi:hypothetical protein
MAPRFMEGLLCGEGLGITGNFWGWREGGGGEAAAAPGARLGGGVWHHGLWGGCYAGG